MAITQDDLRQVQERKRPELVLDADKPSQSGAAKTFVVPCRDCGRDVELTALPAPYAHIKPKTTQCRECAEKAGRQEEANRERLRQEAIEAARRQRQAATDAIRADPPGALAYCGVPKRWRDASFDLCPDLPDRLVKAAREWAESPAGILYFFGGVGCGKSWLAASVLRFILEMGILRLSECRYIAERDYLNGLKAAFDTETAPVSPRLLPMNHPNRVRLLLLDDLAATRLTDWGKDEIAGLVERRHADDLPTIVTSNIDPDGLTAAVDGRVASRIAESRMMFMFPKRDLRIVGDLRERARRARPKISENSA